MELMQKIKNFFKIIQNGPTNKIDLEQESIPNIDDAVNSMCHFPKVSLAISLLELQRLIQILNPKELRKFSDNDFNNVDDRKVFLDAINTLEIVHDRTENIKLKEVH